MSSGQDIEWRRQRRSDRRVLRTECMTMTLKEGL
jgi:hypothetical protein